MSRLILVAGLWLGLCYSEVAARDVRVFAAASLATSLQDVAKAYAATRQGRLKLVFAGSSTLARQIEAGANADIYISADERWMDYLVRRGAIHGPSKRDLLTNRLVVVIPGSANGDVDTTDPGKVAMAQLLDRHLGGGRIAVGDPAHVPVGRYAKAALKELGLWSRYSQRLAAAPDTRAALALVERGEAVGGIVYATDAQASDGVRAIATLPAGSHPEITYPMALAKAVADDRVRHAFAYISGPKAVEIFRRHGFGIK